MQMEDQIEDGQAPLAPLLSGATPVGHQLDEEVEHEPDHTSQHPIAKLIANLLNATTGTSTVALPFCVLYLGVLPTAVVTLVQGSLGVLADHILTVESVEAHTDTYHRLMERRVGRYAAHAAATSIVVNGAGKLVIWLIILTDVILGGRKHRGLLPELLRWRGLYDPDAWYLKRRTWPLLISMATLPAVTFRSLDAIAWVSAFGDAAVIFMALCGLVLAGVAIAKDCSCPVNVWPSLEMLGP